MNAIMTIAGEVARIRGVALNDILSERRTMAVVRPRHEAMYLARHMTPASLPAIGRRLGGKDHTTVLHGIHRVEERIADLPGYGDEIKAIQTAIRLKLPAPASLELVPAADVDAPASAERIMAAVGEGRRVEIYADEVVAIAAALIAADKTIADLTARESMPQPPVLTLTAPEPDRLPMLRRPEIGLLTRAARGAVAAFDKASADRFTPRERYSQAGLDRALATLKTTLEQKDATQ